MSAWPDARVLALFNIDVPIVLGPMAGVGGAELAIAVARAGGLGSIPCAMLSADQIRQQVEQFRAAVRGPINLNFFCHTPPQPDPEREAKWRAHLAPYYAELGIDLNTQVPAVNRAPFDEATCALVEEIKPEVVSFHFGLPAPELQARVKASGAKVIAAATTVEEARWLEARGVDAVIAMGNEAGGHRGMFLTTSIESQVGTFALVPQVVDAVRVPVIAAWYWRCAGRGGGVRPGGICGTDRHGLHAFARSEDVGHPSRRTQTGHGCGYRPHQRVHRSPGARHRQPVDA